MFGVHKLYWSALNTLTFLLSPISWLSPMIAPFMLTFLMLLQPDQRLCRKVAKHIWSAQRFVLKISLWLFCQISTLQKLASRPSVAQLADLQKPPHFARFHSAESIPVFKPICFNKTVFVVSSWMNLWILCHCCVVLSKNATPRFSLETNNYMFRHSPAKGCLKIEQGHTVTVTSSWARCLIFSPVGRNEAS